MADTRITPEFVAKAREALDSMDDYARMESSVAATGPVALLKSFIDVAEQSQRTATAVQMPAKLDMDKLFQVATEWTNMPDDDIEGNASWALVNFVSEHGDARAEEARREAYARGRGDAVRDYIEKGAPVAEAAAQADDVPVLAWAALDLNDRIAYQNESRENVEYNRAYIKTPTRVVGLVAAPTAQPTPDDARIVEAMRPHLDQADGGYACDTAPEHVAAAGRAAAALRQPGALPDEMTPEMMKAVQLKSELGAYAAANLAGAYDLFSEFWEVAMAASKQGGKENRQ